MKELIIELIVDYQLDNYLDMVPDGELDNIKYYIQDKIKELENGEYVIVNLNADLFEYIFMDYFDAIDEFKKHEYKEYTIEDYIQNFDWILKYQMIFDDNKTLVFVGNQNAKEFMINHLKEFIEKIISYY